MKGTSMLQKLQISPPSEVGLPQNRRFNANVVENILGYLADERDEHGTRIVFIRETFQPMMRRLCLVCKSWYPIANKYLYNEIYISSSNALELLADALGRNKALRPLVRQFYFSSKVFAAGNPQLLYTAKDNHYSDRIYELCPNLMSIRRSGSTEKFPFTKDDETNLRILGLKSGDPSQLTYLFVYLPSNVFFGDRMIVTSDVEFPALQTLYIACSRSYYYESRSYERQPLWFKTPQLRRLTLQDFVVDGLQVLRFPRSEYLHTIEIIRGDLTSVDNFFDPWIGPLAPLKKSLQSLTITARGVGDPDALPRRDMWIRQRFGHREDDDTLHLAFLENLTELCIPCSTFAKKEIATYPPNLRELVITGYHGKAYVESRMDQKDAHIKVNKMLIDKFLSPTKPTPHLKRVQVLLRNDTYWKPDYEKTLPKQNVKFQVGFDLYGASNIGSDYLDLGLKALHLK